MSQCTLHHLSATIPRPLTAQDLPALVAELIGVQDLDPLTVRQGKGRYGYREYYSLRDDDGELVAILLDGQGTVQGTSHITIHGRAWEKGQIDPAHVCRYVMDRNGWATETHLAMDDDAHILPWSMIREISTSPRWDSDITTTLCRPRKDSRTGETVGAPVMLTSQTGTTIYFGVRESDTSVCIYDRRDALRVEYRTRTRGGATEIVRRIADGDDLGTLTAGVLARVLRFHVPGPGRKDRRPVARWWTDFLGSVEPVQLPRHRDQRHRSPWYVAPTRADKVKRSVQRHLTGDERDGPVLDVLREIVAGEDAMKIIATEWDTPGAGNQPCNYQSQFSKVELEQQVTSSVLSGSLTQVTPVSVSHDFLPDLSF